MMVIPRVTAELIAMGHPALDFVTLGAAHLTQKETDSSLGPAIYH